MLPGGAAVSDPPPAPRGEGAADGPGRQGPSGLYRPGAVPLRCPVPHSVADTAPRARIRPGDRRGSALSSLSPRASGSPGAGSSGTGRALLRRPGRLRTRLGSSPRSPSGTPLPRPAAARVTSAAASLAPAKELLPVRAGTAAPGRCPARSSRAEEGPWRPAQRTRRAGGSVPGAAAADTGLGSQRGLPAPVPTRIRLNRSSAPVDPRPLHRPALALLGSLRAGRRARELGEERERPGPTGRPGQDEPPAGCGVACTCVPGGGPVPGAGLGAEFTARF